MKVFTELTPECDITAQMYAAGYEKKEIAVLKHRAVSTINNQLQTAFLILGVRNGRELCLDSHFDMRRQRVRIRFNANVELIARVRVRARGRDIPFLYGN